MIGERIKKIRTENNMTQKELAEKLFVTAQAVSRWENGETEPSISTITEMSKIFGVTINELLGIEEEKVVEPTETSEEVVIEQTGNFAYRVVEKNRIGVCPSCGANISSDNKVYSITNVMFCKQCYDKKIERINEEKIKQSKKARIKTLIVGSIWLVLFTLLGIWLYSGKNSIDLFLVPFVIGVLIFTTYSSFKLCNNLISSMHYNIVYKFIKKTINVSSIITLPITMMLFILELVIAVPISIIVYPFAIYKNLKHPEEMDINFLDNLEEILLEKE